MFNNKTADGSASRGEIRSIILALKFIEAKLIQENQNQNPIILLDDVFSELDEGRKEKVYELNESAKLSIINFVEKKQMNTQQENFVNNLIEKQLIIPSQISKKIEFEKPDFKIKFAWLELTEQCNLRCIHCYGNFGEQKTCKIKNIKSLHFNTLLSYFPKNSRKYFCGVNCRERLGGFFYFIYFHLWQGGSSFPSFLSLF